jgi:glycosyltransferase involved in cell wall biosynthesis
VSAAEKRPAVSVIMPIYNGERYLQEALDSVFAQTFCDYDVVCVDDGSTDRSLQLLEQYGSRLMVVRQANAGQSAARNRGVHASTGRYLAFLDQDDRWYPHKLAQQVGLLETRNDVVLVYCNSDRMDFEGHVLQEGATKAEQPRAKESLLGRLIGEGLVLPSSMLIRREMFERVGGFDPLLRGFEDFDLCARLTQQGGIAFLEESGMCYRAHANGFNRAGGITIVRSRERFLLRMRELYAGDLQKQSLINEMLAECYSDWGIEEVREGDRSVGRQRLIKSLGHNPLKFRTYSRLFRSFLPQGTRKRCS